MLMFPLTQKEKWVVSTRGPGRGWQLGRGGNRGKPRRARRGGEDGQAAEGGALRSPSVPCPQAGDCTATPEATVSKSRGGRRVLTGAAAGLVGALAENLAGQFRHEGATAAHAPHRENPHAGRFLPYQRLEWMGDHTHAVTTTRGPRGNHVYAARCMWRKRQQEEQSPQGAEPPGSLLGPPAREARPAEGHEAARPGRPRTCPEEACKCLHLGGKGDPKTVSCDELYALTSLFSPNFTLLWPCHVFKEMIKCMMKQLST